MQHSIVQEVVCRNRVLIDIIVKEWKIHCIAYCSQGECVLP